MYDTGVGAPASCPTGRVRSRTEQPMNRSPSHPIAPGAQAADAGTWWASCPGPIAWRLSHLSEMLTLRADHTAGGHALTRDDYPAIGDAAGAVAAFDAGAAAWRRALLSVDEAALDTVGYCTYPHGSDPDEPFVDIVWWVNQELLHHGAEVALLRDLYRARRY
ncbi:DinB family protein [Streptomyces sp. NPDC006692]|uniref:DinB family protein n=1 Tax=unclassified Streptomyces TaxID=2593676 RepID=UPI00368A8E12